MARTLILLLAAVPAFAAFFHQDVAKFETTHADTSAPAIIADTDPVHQVVARTGWTDLGSLLQSGSVEASLIGDGRFDFRYEPFAIPVGDTYSMEVIGNAGASIVRTEMTQVGERETEFVVAFDAIADHLVGDVTVITEYEGAETHRTTFAANARIDLGTVTSLSGLTGPTQHWYCEGNDCWWIYDPAETTIEFVDQPGVEVAFVYLKVGFTVDDRAVVEAAAVRFGESRAVSHGVARLRRAESRNRRR